MPAQTNGYAMQQEAAQQQQRRILHVIGSAEDRFMFQVSWLYAKNCPRDVMPGGATYEYAVFVPSSTTGGPAAGVTWFYISNGLRLDELDENLFLAKMPRSKTLPENVLGPMTTGEMMSLVEMKQQSAAKEAKAKYYDLMVPHCFCYQGMTFFRQLFENMMGIPHPGPDGLCNAICQNKALTRKALADVANVKIPKGETLMISRPFSRGEIGESQELPHPSLPLPFVVKPACEDNSRGVSLVRSEEEVTPALEKAFAYGKTVVVEEFIPGREVRVGAIEQNGELHVLSCKIEYLMRDKNCPIRREEDKLTAQPAATITTGSPTLDSLSSTVCSSTGSNTDSGTEEEAGSEDANTKLVQTKCEREFLTPGCGENSLSPATIAALDAAVIASHSALGSRDYSLFDFRIHAETGEPYIIEACSFWTFTPISVISLMLERSEEFFDRTEGEVIPGHTFKRIAGELWAKTASRA